jgi:hypothetical protein
MANSPHQNRNIYQLFSALQIKHGTLAMPKVQHCRYFSWRFQLRLQLTIPSMAYLPHQNGHFSEETFDARNGYHIEPLVWASRFHGHISSMAHSEC